PSEADEEMMRYLAPAPGEAVLTTFSALNRFQREGSQADQADVLLHPYEEQGLPASAIGAPHPRYRVFILARRTVPDPARLGRLPRRRESAAGEGASWDHRAFTPDHRLRPPRTAWLTEQEQRLRDSVFTD